MSCGIRCAGDLYLPSTVKNPPIVIMGHGFAAEKCFRLPAYAERFLENGMAAFLFDYRTFGESDGEPRHWVSPRRHLQDWKAGLSHVRALPHINPKKIGLWGSSFGGGHVLVTAAHNPDIAAVVSQVPYIGPSASNISFSPKTTILTLWSGIRDIIRMVTLRKPYYLPVVGKPGTFAAMTTEESWPGYHAIIPEESTWENKFTARAFLAMPFYNPLRVAGKIKAPTLLLTAKRDSLCAWQSLQKGAEKIEKCEFVTVDCNHFDVYAGHHFDRVADIEVGFLAKHLL